jgi:propanol-preferring alcohol dehydrogenase
MQVTMKAAVVRSFGKPLAIEDVPIPTPGPGEVLVKVRACGVCHTDLHAASGDWPIKPRLSLHSGSRGRRDRGPLGPGVDTLKVGDPVGVAWRHAKRNFFHSNESTDSRSQTSGH